jgi:hypothetical protein
VKDRSDLVELVSIFDRLAADGFTMTAGWEAAHALCQAHEGEPLFDWGHALCHRVEGDAANAAYWYRRANKPVAKGAIADEWLAMTAEISRLA